MKTTVSLTINGKSVQSSVEPRLHLADLLREEMRLTNAIVSVDGLELKEFDFIDIGAMLPASGAVPVVIKSLIFPASAAPGTEWQAGPRALGRVGV